ncbi:MAG: biotin synthase BioB [Arenicellales bacterium]|nr:biotin synthase BioB [Arenicellales bacterium]
MTNSVSVSPGQQPTSTRPKWTTSAVLGLFEWPFMDIVHRAQEIHRNHFEPNAVQLSSLLSIKTGACPEDCAYCPQSAHYKTGVVAEKLLSTDKIIDAAREAKRYGATRFCMGAAWRAPKDKDLEEVIEAIEGVKALGLETCATLGMLTQEQAERLKEAGLDYYNHNLDTSEAFYDSIITTRTYQDRLDTLNHVQACGLKVCCGGIIGMGETREDRAAMIATLATLPTPPQSVPINMLVQTRGTPLDGMDKPDPFEFVRTIAAARITMPSSYVRLSAGRHDMNDEMQALCFLAGANSIFYGDKLLTTGNASVEHDKNLLQRLGMTVEDSSVR